MAFSHIDGDMEVGAKSSFTASVSIKSISAVIKSISVVPLNDIKSANFDVEIFEDNLFQNYESVYLAQSVPERLDDILDLYYIDKVPENGQGKIHLKICNNSSITMNYRIKIKYMEQ